MEHLLSFDDGRAPAATCRHTMTAIRGADEGRKRETFCTECGTVTKREPAMPEPPEGFPLTVSPEEIPFGTAVAAYTWNSMMPEDRARREQADYLGELFDVWKRFAPLATDDERRARLVDHMERYRERLRRHSLAMLAARSRVANPMVTGPAKFPTRRNQKALATEDRRREEYLEWRKRALSAIARDMAPPEPSAEEQLAKLEAQRDRMKAMNAEYRKCKGDIDAMTIPSAALKETMKTTRATYWRGRSSFVPFEAFELTSINGKIKRLQANVAKEQHRARVAEALAGEVREILAGDVRIVDNVADDRVQVFYPSKPDAETRDKLKAHGFRWAPSSGAWQAYRTNHTAWRVRQLFGVELKLA